MRTSFLPRTAAALLAALPASLPAQTPFTVPEIPVERYALPNGLTVLLSPDHSSSVVTVDVWYHVGSKNETPGRTGFAHLFEHMMFQGSAHIPYGVHPKTIESVGGVLNGSTQDDRTNYYETVPSNQLATALWLESDRMGFLLPALDQRKLDAQRDVVKNERRQRVDNQPFGAADEAIRRALYAPTNPYSWPVIGSMADLSAATLDDVETFFRTYYAPNNATLAVVGDFDVARAKALIARYFGPIPSGPPVPRPAIAPVTLAAERRLVLEDRRAREPELRIIWPTVPLRHPDEPALSVLARTLVQDRTSRLTKLLVYDRQVATRVSAWQGAKEGVGTLEIDVTPRPGVSLATVEQLVDSALAALRTTAPITEAEVERYRRYTQVMTVLSLDGSMMRAEMLLYGETFAGDPAYYRTSTAALLAVTPADLARVAATYLTPGRVVLSMVPAGKLALIAAPDSSYTNVTPSSNAPSNAP
ncbi:MAG: insulinase family protein [Gemmatimonadaceae bacterium]|nr:insulinase family protein [Gemmatimonadaceae bacterium]